MSRAGTWFLGAILLAPLTLTGLPRAAAPAPQDPPPTEEPPEEPTEEASEESSEETPEPVEVPAPQEGTGTESTGEAQTAQSEGQGETPPPAPETGATEETGAERDPESQVETPQAQNETPAGETGGEGAESTNTDPDAGADSPAGGSVPVETPPPGQPGLPPGTEPPEGVVNPGLAAPVPVRSVPPAAQPAPVPFPAFQPAYRSLSEVLGLFESFAAAAPGPARSIELGRTLGGQVVPALEFGAPGGTPLEERPTVLLLGGLDGRSLAGGEAVLAATHALLADAAGLPENVTFVAVPWASPGPLERMASGIGDGRNARPTDDDRDGRLDEDAPDDLDGDGMILDMLIEHPEGPWVRGGDGRFLVPARAGDGTRYLWTREGKDDDGDGRFNEDPPGGVVLDRNFPVHREGPWQDPRVGRLPMSEPLVRSLADFASSRRTVLVLLFQGHHGAVATPAEADPADAEVYRRVTEAFLAATGRQQAGPLTLREARAEPCPGAAIDWFHEVLGALSLEVAPWGPGVEGGTPVSAQSAQFAPLGTRTPGEQPRALEGRPRLGERENAWAAWLDNTRGGLGFVDWQPVELGAGRQGLVGGWQPFTIENPPPESLARALEGLPEFVSDLAGSLPRLEVRATSSRDGDLCRVSAQIKNLGLLPTSLGGERGAPLSLDLVLPAGAQLVAGEVHVEFDRLLGRELTASVDWVVVAPAGSLLRLNATSAWTGSVVREVKP